MKIAIINKSDSTGGAAVVSLRLTQALRNLGHDARLIVTEKLTDYPYVTEAASNTGVKIPFLAERLKIFLANGRNRATLFQFDTASDGLPIHRLPFVQEADAICLNWVNQGMLSLKEIGKLLDSGKPVVWTMHDMWCMTGICHHAGSCTSYKSPSGLCRECPLMPTGSRLALKTLLRKKKLYEGKTGNRIHFVCVSNWLAGLAKSSTLLYDQDVSVIPNAFPIDRNTETNIQDEERKDKKRIVFGAARLDDPVKGLSVLAEATKILADNYPAIAGRLELITFGGVKNPDSLNGITIAHKHLGKVDPSAIRSIYESGDIVVSTSEWETLPGTLIEGQAWGCIPVALDHGGQRDIIDHLRTGYLAPYDEDPHKNAEAIAEGIIWAFQAPVEVRDSMHKSVCDRFSEEAVAKRYLEIFNKSIRDS